MKMFCFQPKSNISSDSLIQTVVETLSNEGVDLLPLTNGITDNTWKSLIEAKKVDPLLSKLNTHVSEAKATKSKGASARLTAGNKLKIATKPLLNQDKYLMLVIYYFHIYFQHLDHHINLLSYIKKLLKIKHLL